MSETTFESSQLLRFTDAARLRGKTRQWLFNYVRSGKITVTEIGGVKYVRAGEVMNLPEKQRYNRKNKLPD